MMVAVVWSSFRKCAAFIVSAAILIAAVLACSLSNAGSNAAVTPVSTSAPSFTPAATTPIPPAASETATVIAIIDGDTIEVEIGGRSYRLRYIGMDTPERGDPFFSEATEVNRLLVEGQTALLVRDVSETDRYGRLLRYVYLPDGTFVNAELVRLGYAQVATFPPDVRHQELFLDLQRAAREAGRGIWAQSAGLESVPSLQATAPPETTAPAAGCDCSGNVYNCGAFQSQAEAQACFVYCLQVAGRDVHDLDGDGDGRACEALP
ncbi:MAG: thermonuclease family protein [Chloroflexi bacterium]|nr:thermonuclease family protein [Chloroflexota bacterium]MCI0645574.1 thermonuclease family protein [Chloroflexota bacterium]MCI0727755.1 thermonuclease family protein [Chloroflexota bacterium]